MDPSGTAQSRRGGRGEDAHVDDQDRASGLTKAAFAGCGLLVALVAVGVLAYGELTGRPVPWPGRARRHSPAAAPAADGTWRSERWIAEAVERGLRELDAWRLEQRDA